MTFAEKGHPSSLDPHSNRARLLNGNKWHQTWGDNFRYWDLRYTIRGFPHLKLIETSWCEVATFCWSNHATFTISLRNSLSLHAHSVKLHKNCTRPKFFAEFWGPNICEAKQAKKWGPKDRAPLIKKAKEAKMRGRRAELLKKLKSDHKVSKNPVKANNEARRAELRFKKSLKAVPRCQKTFIPTNM